MLAFSIVSGVGLAGAAWLFERFSRRPRPATSRVLAVVLALGAILFVIRPVHALRHDGEPGCHDAGATAAEDAGENSLHHHEP
jgi:hypothetical protein